MLDDDPICNGAEEIVGEEPRRVSGMGAWQIYYTSKPTHDARVRKESEREEGVGEYAIRTEPSPSDHERGSTRTQGDHCKLDQTPPLPCCHLSTPPLQARMAQAS